MCLLMMSDSLYLLLSVSIFKKNLKIKVLITDIHGVIIMLWDHLYFVESV